MPLEFVGCIGGCDESLMELLDLRFSRGNPRASQPASQPSNYLQASQSLNRISSAPRALPPPAATSGSDSVTCNCGQEAVLLTVRKEGPNQGRQFYKCNSGGCNFFLWADSSPPDAGGPPSAPRPASDSPGHPPGPGDRRGGSSRPGDDSSGATSCLCSQPTVTRTVQKDGPNKGRQFHTCAKPREQQCGFFQWADENVAPGEAGRVAGTRPPSQARAPLGFAFARWSPPPRAGVAQGGAAPGAGRCAPSLCQIQGRLRLTAARGAHGAALGTLSVRLPSPSAQQCRQRYT